MPNQKLTLRDVLILSWAGLTCRLGRLITLCGLALLFGWVYMALLAGPKTALVAAWNILLLAMSTTLLGAALWLRERRSAEAFKEDCRCAYEHYVTEAEENRQ